MRKTLKKETCDKESQISRLPQALPKTNSVLLLAVLPSPPLLSSPPSFPLHRTTVLLRTCTRIETRDATYIVWAHVYTYRPHVFMRFTTVWPRHSMLYVPVRYFWYIHARVYVQLGEWRATSVASVSMAVSRGGSETRLRCEIFFTCAHTA